MELESTVFFLLILKRPVPIFLKKCIRGKKRLRSQIVWTGMGFVGLKKSFGLMKSRVVFLLRARSIRIFAALVKS